MTAGFTYMVSGNIVSGGRKVPIGYVLEEAATWRHVDTYVNNGALTRITNEAAKGMPRYPDDMPADEAGDELPEPEVEEVETFEAEELTQEQYNDLSTDEVEELVDGGILSLDEVEDFESKRPGRSRNAVLALLEDEDGEDDENVE